MIQGLQAGEPKYEIMSTDFGDQTRRQLPQLKALVDEFGALHSMKFTGVGPAGADLFEVQFEHATVEWRIMLGPDGKITTIGFPR